MFFRAYEMLGERKYLDAALKFCDLLLYAHRLSGEAKSLEAARRDADLIFAIPDPGKQGLTPAT